MTDIRPSNVARRRAAERRFRFYGAAAMTLTAAFLVSLIADIVIKAIPAFHEHRVVLQVLLDPAAIDAANPRAGDYDSLIRKAFRGLFPSVTTRGERKALSALLSKGAADDLRTMVAADPGLIGQTVGVPALLSDDADLYLEGSDTAMTTVKRGGALQVHQSKDIYRLTGDTSRLAPGMIVRINGGALRIVSGETDGMQAEALIPPSRLDASSAGQWDVVAFSVKENERRIDDRQALWLESLRQKGLVERGFAWRFFTAGDSREPELAGLRGALVGSLLTVAVALSLALPLGVAAAIYLEAFAPKGRLTDLIEVNINNLAAVPSIVFGLLGLAVFLNFFGLPRSAPVAGGLVLALLVLPTIIIASRAALKAVPPSIAEAALGVGASPQQAVFHHVLPLALPGILTGTILALARVLGETAPLLMIGMVAFIVDVPKTFTDAATALPVQVFLWSDLPEIGFQSKTAAAIVVLLAVLFCLNAVAVYLRKRFERRW